MLNPGTCTKFQVTVLFSLANRNMFLIRYRCKILHEESKIPEQSQDRSVNPNFENYPPRLGLQMFGFDISP